MFNSGISDGLIRQSMRLCKFGEMVLLDEKLTWADCSCVPESTWGPLRHRAAHASWWENAVAAEAYVGLLLFSDGNVCNLLVVWQEEGLGVVWAY